MTIFIDNFSRKGLLFFIFAAFLGLFGYMLSIGIEELLENDYIGLNLVLSPFVLFMTVAFGYAFLKTKGSIYNRMRKFAI